MKDVLITAMILVVASIWLRRVEVLIRELLVKPLIPSFSQVVLEDPIPPDLVLFANQESQDWARGQMLDAFRETYSKVKDWQKVREGFGISTGTI